MGVWVFVYVSAYQPTNSYTSKTALRHLNPDADFYEAIYHLQPLVGSVEILEPTCFCLLCPQRLCTHFYHYFSLKIVTDLNLNAEVCEAISH